MKRYIKSTRYTVTYDDEKIQYAADYVKEYLMGMTRNEFQLVSNPDIYDSRRVDKLKLAEALNSFFMGKAPNTFHIDVNGKVEHAHGIGNNNLYQLILWGTKGNPGDVICGYIYINLGFYGDAYIGVKDLDKNLVGDSIMLGPSGYLEINDKVVKRF